MAQHLVEKVKVQISACQTYLPLRDAGHGEHPDRHLTPGEEDLVRWGLAVGLAYATARAEDPTEPDSSVASRALEAARLAHGDRAHSPVPPGGPDMLRISQLYTRFSELIHSPTSSDSDLDHALNELGAAILGAEEPG